ncbi:hypothetical protein P3X46_020069 [Hevea brasiliensis]|uniref:Uncharacterized protein n=1 Tax=Hevea brasiliensis TaxID=3981 RepID=A0ABQ9LPV3_HEVBR|nr:hypothetical protein P3X46_020069 [Hevea brasiliensis]
MGGSQRGKAVVVPDDSANKENDASQTRRSSRGVFFTYLNENNSMGNAVLMKTSLNPMFNSVVKMVEERHVLKTCERDANPSKSSIVPRTMVDSSLVQSNFTRPPDPMQLLMGAYEGTSRHENAFDAALDMDKQMVDDDVEIHSREEDIDEDDEEEEEFSEEEFNDPYLRD